MAKKNPLICPYCGGVILEDHQETCDWCGAELEEEKNADLRSTDSCLGSIGTGLLVFLVIIFFLIQK